MHHSTTAGLQTQDTTKYVYLFTCLLCIPACLHQGLHALLALHNRHTLSSHPLRLLSSAVVRRSVCLGLQPTVSCAGVMVPGEGVTVIVM